MAKERMKRLTQMKKPGNNGRRSVTLEKHRGRRIGGVKKAAGMMLAFTLAVSEMPLVALADTGLDMDTHTDVVIGEDSGVVTEEDSESESQEIEVDVADAPAALAETDGTVQTGYLDGTNNMVSWSYDPTTKTTVVTGSGVRSVDVSVTTTSCFPMDTERVEFVSCELEGSLQALFARLKNLSSVDFTGLVMTNVTDISYMFSDCSGLQELNLSNFETGNVTSMHGMFYGCSGLQKLNVSNFETGNVTDMSYMFLGCSGLQELNVSNFKTGNVTDMGGMFYYCSGLQELNVSNFETGNVTDMESMFSYCSGLQELNVSNFETGNVTNMYKMFSYCSGLQELNVSNFETGNVTDMGGMFYDCSGLQELNVSNFETGNVTDMGFMFYYCSGFQKLNVSNFETGNVTDMGYMFSGCSGLQELNVSNFETGNVTDMGGMFSGCSGLQELNVSNFDLSNVLYILSSGMFSGCNALKSLQTPKAIPEGAEISLPSTYQDTTGREADYLTSEFVNTTLTKVDEQDGWTPFGYPAENGNQLSYLYDESTQTLNITGEGRLNQSDDAQDAASLWTMDAFVNLEIAVVRFVDCKIIGSMDYAFAYNSDVADSERKVQQIDFSGLDTSNVTSMGSMFSGCRGLQELELSNLETGNVTNMSNMFSGCRGLQELDLSSLETGNVTNMSNMFSGCSGLKKLDISNFATGNVINMSDMFYDCNGLQELDLSNFATENVINMRDMFYECDGLQKLDLSNFVTENVTNMYEMFHGCDGLKELDLSNFATGNVINMSAMFYGCDGLQELDLSSFKTGNVTNMGQMFSGCSGLQELDLSNFETGNVTYMYDMFWCCRGLQKLDLSNFKTGNVTDMARMFYSCSGLQKLDLSNFETGNVTDMARMFLGCEGLQELDLSNFDLSNVSSMFNMFSRCNALKSLLTPQVIPEGRKIPLLSIYQDPTGRETAYLTSEFINTTLTKVDEQNGWTPFGCPAENGNQLSYLYDESTQTLNITGEGRLNQSDDAQDAASLWTRDEFADLEIAVVRFVDCKIIGSMDYAFAYNSDMADAEKKIQQIDLSGLDTSNVTSMRYMFYGCSGLQELNLSNFDLSNVSAMADMFSGCNALKSLQTPKVIPEGMEISLPSAYQDTAGRETTNLTSEFVNTTLTKVDEQDVWTPFGYPAENGNLLSYLYDESTKTLNITGEGRLNQSDDAQDAASLWTRDEFANLKIGVVRFVDCKITGSMKGAFAYNSDAADSEKVQQIDFSGLDTSNVVSMAELFKGCSNLQELDLSSFDTSAVTDMNEMFAGCNSLQTLHTPKAMGSVTAVLPAVYKDASGNSTSELTADFVGSVLTKVVETTDHITSSELTEIQNALTAEEVKTIDYVLPEKESIPVESQKEIFTKLQDSEKTFSFVFQDEAGREAYRWTFEGNEIKEPERTVEFQIIVDANNEDVLVATPDDVQEVDLEFINEGVLPGRAKITIGVEQYFEADRLYLYYYNPETRALELLDDNVAFDGVYASIFLEHSSNYILTAAMLQNLLPDKEHNDEDSDHSGENDNNEQDDNNDQGGEEEDEEDDAEDDTETVQIVQAPIAPASQYTVVKGDTLSKIARTYQMTLAKLLSMNTQIKNPNRIYVGQVIMVNHGQAAESAAAPGVTENDAEEYYIVQKGDSFYGIATKNKIPLDTLLKLNSDMAAQKYIFPGQKMRIR